jgi:hypothetical protein
VFRNRVTEDTVTFRHRDETVATHRSWQTSVAVPAHPPRDPVPWCQIATCREIITLLTNYPLASFVSCRQDGCNGGGSCGDELCRKILEKDQPPSFTMAAGGGAISDESCGSFTSGTGTVCTGTIRAFPLKTLSLNGSTVRTETDRQEKARRSKKPAKRLYAYYPVLFCLFRF